MPDYTICKFTFQIAQS